MAIVLHNASLISLQSLNQTASDRSNVTVNASLCSDNNTDPSVDVFILLMSGPLYYNLAERCIAIISMIIMLIFGLTGNLLVIIFIIRDRRNHTPYLTTIACFAISDFVALAVYYLTSLYVSVVNNLDIFRHAYYKLSCGIYRMVMVPSVLSQTGCVGLIALERDLFFSHPYVHERQVTVGRVLAIEALMWALSFTNQMVAVTYGTSYYSISSLTCSLFGVRWYFLPSMIIWIDIPGFVTLVIVIKLTYMILKKRRQIKAEQTFNGRMPRAPEQSLGFEEGPSNSATARSVGEGEGSEGGGRLRGTGVVLVKKAGRREQGGTGNRPSNGSQAKRNLRKDNVLISTMLTAVKLVGCISLGYWLTYIPCLIVLHEVFNHITVFDLELGRSIKWHFIIRYFYFFGLVSSTVINPVFHFVFNRRLKRDLLSMFGCARPTEFEASSASDVA